MEVINPVWNIALNRVSANITCPPRFKCNVFSVILVVASASICSCCFLPSPPSFVPQLHASCSHGYPRLICHTRSPSLRFLRSYCSFTYSRPCVLLSPRPSPPGPTHPQHPISRHSFSMCSCRHLSRFSLTCIFLASRPDAS